MRSRQRIYLVLGVTLAAAAGTAMLPWRTPGNTSAAAAPAPPTAPRVIDDRIHVERTLVQATDLLVERRVPVERPVRSDRALVRPRREAAAPPAMSRVRRVLFGSGRHRPEPFPRASLQNASAR
jgi:hypothetical protein